MMKVAQPCIAQPVYGGGDSATVSILLRALEQTKSNMSQVPMLLYKERA